MSFQELDSLIIPDNQTNVEKVLKIHENIEILDEESSKGRFGWFCMEQNQYVPYIYRHGTDRYVSIRILERKVLNGYLQLLPPDITSCIRIRSFYMTDTEARLLNDINTIHCDGIFGKERLTSNDLVVTLSDVEH